jgi:hypothetical protein
VIDPREHIQRLDQILKVTRFAKRHLPIMTDMEFENIIKKFLSAKKRWEKRAKQMEKEGYD